MEATGATQKKSKNISQSKLVYLDDVTVEAGMHIQTGITELDRTLGGGYVSGSVILLGGDPGIGKSTIILQALAGLNQTDKTCLYISGEESASQIKLRASRMGYGDMHLAMIADNNIDSLLTHITELTPDVVVIDSIQTMHTDELASAPGTIGQVRESAFKLIEVAKRKQICMFIIGHVTKDGAIAGPKVLEHMVDAVLYFEGERNHSYRILRTIKNRFGSTNEIGVFEMTGKGLMEVSDPSGIFLSQRPKHANGSTVIATMEGSRPVLSEVQALVSSAGGGGMPRRTCIGIDHNRVALLIAILEKIHGIDLKGQDVFVNIAGGMRITEPAADLGILLAIYSSFINQHIDPNMVIMGEVGLSGEIRAIMSLDRRLSEAKKMGFESAIVPKASCKRKPDIDLTIYSFTELAQCVALIG